MASGKKWNGATDGAGVGLFTALCPGGPSSWTHRGGARAGTSVLDPSYRIPPISDRDPVQDPTGNHFSV